MECPEHKVRQVALPWARERSGFTLLFEALVMAMVKEMPVKAVAGLVGEYDKRIWRIVHHYVDQAVEAQDLAGVERVGIDETSGRRGHEYVSVFADLDQHRGVFCVEGRDHPDFPSRYPSQPQPHTVKLTGDTRDCPNSPRKRAV